MKDIYISGNNDNREYEDVYSDSSGIPVSTLDEPQYPGQQNYGGENRIPGMPPVQPPAPVKKKKKKKKGFFRRLFKVLITIFIIVTLLISVVALASGYNHTKLGRNEYVTPSELNNSPFVTNILLIGTDSEEGGPSRSDSMIMISLDFIHRKIKMTSFLRDCYIEIPSLGTKKKINAAYAKGGSQLLCDTIEYNFGVDIDHYVKVDFDMFTRIIDDIGGIDVEVTEKEASFINRTTRHTVQSGESVHLSGAEALVYARIRKLDSDYMRSFRQRKIITALINKLTHSNPVMIFKSFREVLPLLETDINALEVSFTLYKGAFAALFFDIEQAQMPGEKMMTTGYAGSEWVEFPNLEECRKFLYEFIYTGSAVQK